LDQLRINEKPAKRAARARQTAAARRDLAARNRVPTVADAPDELMPPVSPPTTSPRRVLGSGTFGCTFEPYYPCKNPADDERMRNKMLPDKIYLSKLVSASRGAGEERQMYERVKRLDPNGIFTVPMLGVCSAQPQLDDFYTAGAKESKQPCKYASDNLRKTFTTEGGSLPQLIYEHGGQNLDEAVKVVPLRDLLISLTPVVCGLAGIQEASQIAAERGQSLHFFHRDIKPANIVYNGCQSRLIDFGACVSSDIELLDAYVMSGEYFAWPPEVDLLSELESGVARRKTNADATASFLRKYKKTKRDAGFDQVLRGEPDVMNSGALYAEMKGTMEELLKQQEPTLSEEQYQGFWTEKFMYKFDSFSLGVAIAILINDSVSTREMSPALWRKIFNWVDNTINPNAFNRYDAIEARDAWLTLWSESDLARLQVYTKLDIIDAAVQIHGAKIRAAAASSAAPTVVHVLPPVIKAVVETRIELGEDTDVILRDLSSPAIENCGPRCKRRAGNFWKNMVRYIWPSSGVAEAVGGAGAYGGKRKRSRSSSMKRRRLARKSPSRRRANKKR